MYKMFITPYNFISMSDFLQANSQFFLLLITLYTVLKILSLEKRVYKLETRLDYVHCLVQQQEQEEQEEDEEETSSESDDSKDEDYEPTSEDEKEEE